MSNINHIICKSMYQSQLVLFYRIWNHLCLAQSSSPRNSSSYLLLCTQTWIFTPTRYCKLRIWVYDFSHTKHKSTDAMDQTHNVFNGSTSNRLWSVSEVTVLFKLCAILIWLHSSPHCKSWWCVSCWAFLYGELPSKIMMYPLYTPANNIARPITYMWYTTTWQRIKARTEKRKYDEKCGITAGYAQVYTKSRQPPSVWGMFMVDRT